MTEVKCEYCGWEGSMSELESEVLNMGLDKTSLCPECGANSRNDYVVVV